MANPIKRLNYFDHQFLRAPDFSDEQTYHLGMRRLHNKLFHSWGIASGMQVTSTLGTSSVASVSSGMALDAAGHEIVLVDVTSTPDLSAMKGQTVFVTVTYTEQPSDPSTDAGAAGNTRTTESGKVEVVAAPADPSLNLVLARLTIDANGKIASSDDGADLNLRRLAGASGADLVAHSLTLTDPNNPVTTWPKLSVAAQASTRLTGDLTLTGGLTTGGAIAAGSISTTGQVSCNGYSAGGSASVQGSGYFGQNVQIHGPLRVDSVTGINQARLFLSGGYGTNNPTWSSISYNAHHDETNQAWNFADGSRPAVTLEMDDNAGFSRFEVYSTTTAAKTTWLRRFAVNGENGNIVLAENGGTVSVGNAAVGSQVRFEVHGRSRIRQDPSTGWTAGLWLYQTAVGDAAFVGMRDDRSVGFWGAGWGMWMDTNTFNVTVVGTVTARGVAFPSDVRLKEDINPISDPLGKVAAIRGVSYVLSASREQGRDIGVIAQDVEQVLPELVTTSDSTGMKAVDYCKLSAVLVEAIKELKRQLDDLKNSIPRPATQS